MATPAFQNDPAFTSYMQREFQKLHQQNLFMPDPRYSKEAAHREAFRRAMIARQQGRI